MIVHVGIVCACLISWINFETHAGMSWMDAQENPASFMISLPQNVTDVYLWWSKAVLNRTMDVMEYNVTDNKLSASVAWWGRDWRLFVGAK